MKKLGIAVAFILAFGFLITSVLFGFNTIDKGAKEVAEERLKAERAAATYYTSEVIELNLDKNTVILDTGVEIDLMRGWRQAIIPDIGDIVSYGETEHYGLGVFNNKLGPTGEVKYIDMKVIGSTKGEGDLFH